MFQNLILKVHSLLSAVTIEPTKFEWSGITVFWAMIGEFFRFLGNGICVLFYSILKWFLAFCDFLQYFIQKLIGLDYWLSNSTYTLSGATKSDLLFSFLFNDTVQRVFRVLLILFIVLLIVFTIFQIIRQEWSFITGENFGDGKSNSKSKIIRGSIKAIALVIVFPLVLIVGIISSNAILASIVKALNIDMSSTFGSTIFSIASVQSNKYRKYSDGDYRSATSNEVNFYIISASKVSKGEEDGNIPSGLSGNAGKYLMLSSTDYVDEKTYQVSSYEKYLKAIQYCDRYTVSSMLDAVSARYDYNFHGYCISLPLGKTTEYYLVKVQNYDLVSNSDATASTVNYTNSPAAWYYYLNNVLQVQIMSSSNSIGNTSIQKDLGNFQTVPGIYGSPRCYVNGRNLQSFSGSDAIVKAARNTWNYNAIYDTAFKFDQTLNYAILRSGNKSWKTIDDGSKEVSLIEDIMGLNKGYNEVKYFYNSNKISPYFDGGQLGVVQLKAEYLVMAEVIDFILQNQVELYMMQSTSSLIDWDYTDAKNGNGYQVDTRYIKTAQANGVTTNDGYFEYGDTKYKPFVVSYNEACESAFGNVLYMSNAKATNEVDGAVYIMCVKSDDGRFLPLVNGETFYKNDGSSFNFKSSYYTSEYRGVVIAKGMLDAELSTTDTMLGKPTYLSTSSTGFGSVGVDDPFYYEIVKKGQLTQYAGNSEAIKESYEITNVDFEESLKQSLANDDSKAGDSNTKIHSDLVMEAPEADSVADKILSYKFIRTTETTTKVDDEIKIDTKIESLDMYENSSFSSLDYGKRFVITLKDEGGAIDTATFLTETGGSSNVYEVNIGTVENPKIARYYLYKTARSHQFLILKIEDGKTLNILSFEQSGDVNNEWFAEEAVCKYNADTTSFDNAKVNAIDYKYNLYYDYEVGDTKLSNNSDRVVNGFTHIDGVDLSATAGFGLSRTEGGNGSYLFKTVDTITFVLDGSNSNTSYMNIAFDNGYLFNFINNNKLGEEFRPGLRFTKPIDPDSNSNGNAHTSLLFDAYLYNFYTAAYGYYSDNGDLHYKKIEVLDATANSILYKSQSEGNKLGSLDVQYPTNDKMKISFKVNADFDWNITGNRIGLYDGAINDDNYVASIYKRSTDSMLTADNLATETSRILINYNEYSNILTQNLFITNKDEIARGSVSGNTQTFEHWFNESPDIDTKEEYDNYSKYINYSDTISNAIKTKYTSNKESFATECKRDALKYNTFHDDVNFNFFSSSFRFGYAMCYDLIDKTVHTFNLTEGVIFDYFFDGSIKFGDFYKGATLSLFGILIFSTVLINKVLGKALWGVIKRFYEITLYFLAMPVLASTIPLDDGKRFTESVQKNLVQRVLSTYGVIIGLNVFFILLVPIHSMSNVFTAEDIATSGSYFLQHLNVSVSFLNSIVYILFFLVAFTMVDALPGLVSSLVGGQDLVKIGEDTKKSAMNNLKEAGDTLSGKKAMDKAGKVWEGVKKTPAGQLIKKIHDKGKKDKNDATDKGTKEAQDDIKATQSTGENKEKSRATEQTETGSTVTSSSRAVGGNGRSSNAANASAENARSRSREEQIYDAQGHLISNEQLFNSIKNGGASEAITRAVAEFIATGSGKVDTETYNKVLNSMGMSHEMFKNLRDADPVEFAEANAEFNRRYTQAMIDQNGGIKEFIGNGFNSSSNSFKQEILAQIGSMSDIEDYADDMKALKLGLIANGNITSENNDVSAEIKDMNKSILYQQLKMGNSQILNNIFNNTNIINKDEILKEIAGKENGLEAYLNANLDVRDKLLDFASADLSLALTASNREAYLNDETKRNRIGVITKDSSQFEINRFFNSSYDAIGSMEEAYTKNRNYLAKEDKRYRSAHSGSTIRDSYLNIKGVSKDARNMAGSSAANIALADTKTKLKNIGNIATNITPELYANVVKKYLSDKDIKKIYGRLGLEDGLANARASIQKYEIEKYLNKQIAKNEKRVASRGYISADSSTAVQISSKGALSRRGTKKLGKLENFEGVKVKTEEIFAGDSKVDRKKLKKRNRAAYDSIVKDYTDLNNSKLKEEARKKILAEEYKKLAANPNSMANKARMDKIMKEMATSNSNLDRIAKATADVMARKNDYIQRFVKGQKKAAGSNAGINSGAKVTGGTTFIKGGNIKMSDSELNSRIEKICKDYIQRNNSLIQQIVKNSVVNQTLASSIANSDKVKKQIVKQIEKLKKENIKKNEKRITSLETKLKQMKNADEDLKRQLKELGVEIKEESKKGVKPPTT